MTCQPLWQFTSCHNRAVLCLVVCAAVFISGCSRSNCERPQTNTDGCENVASTTVVSTVDGVKLGMSFVEVQKLFAEPLKKFPVGYMWNKDRDPTEEEVQRIPSYAVLLPNKIRLIFNPAKK